jgi:CP family cyanate transporter-like MFS transporter
VTGEAPAGTTPVPTGATAPPRRTSRHERVLVAGTLLFVAFNMRPAIASISPVLPEIRRSDGLTAPVVGLLTTLPLVCFGLLAPLTPALIRRGGTRRVILWCLCGITLGITLRSLPPVPALFAGTVLLGACLAIVNVQMPGIVKSRFEARAGLATGLYTTMVNVGIAVAAGATVPLTRALGSNWRLAIGIWAVVAILAATLWGRARDLVVPASAAPPPVRPPAVWRSGTAWWITLYMGLQSLSFFSVLAWLPTILRDRGLSAPAAGGVLSLVGIVAIPAALVAPVVASRKHNLRLAILGSTASTALGLVGLLVEPHGLEALSAMALAIGQGSSLSLALVLMVLRAEDSPHALAISGMAQGVGYLVAAAGPATVGAIEVESRGWTAPIALLLALACGQLLAGWVAASRR